MIELKEIQKKHMLLTITIFDYFEQIFHSFFLLIHIVTS